jgi:hypothetical protein
MKGFKAYNKGLVCLGMRYKVGQTHELEGTVEICDRGFHFCENPLDVLNYYDLCESEFTEVEALGEVQGKDDDGDSKRVTNKLKIGAKLDLPGFIKASFNFLWEKCNSEEKTSGRYSQLASSGHSSKLASSGDYSQLASSGDYSQLASSGHYSQLASSGDYSQLASSGDYSHLASSGDYSQLASSGHYSKLASSGHYSKLASSGDYSQLASSGDSSKLASSGHSSKLASSGHSSQLASSGHSSKLASSGDYSQLAIDGKYSVGACVGVGSEIKGKIGCWITLAEWKREDSNHIPTCVKSAQIDGEVLKEDVWYSLKNGEFVECE